MELNTFQWKDKRGRKLPLGKYHSDNCCRHNPLMDAKTNRLKFVENRIFS